MEDHALTQLFTRMDEHLARQDAYLLELRRTDQEQNAMLGRMAEMLATTARQVAEIHAEASRQHAATMQAFQALITRLEGRGDADTGGRAV